MEIKEIMSHVDHTLLKQEATWEDIKVICDDACRYGTASVCIPAAFVKSANEYLGEKMPVCTVIGFPNGYATTATKCFETDDALKNGAKEIDMVIHIGALKEKRYNDILSEIRSIKEVCGKNILKVIIETCLLTDEEKIAMCKIVGEAGADYIKTSTGFSSGGATFDDIRLFKKNVPEGLLIKAAGGIKTFDDAREFISLGADRLGTSRLVSILKQEKIMQKY
ncbi:MAG: deoxyribose-phosphate aldolase [Ruminococcaceae bacterium]|nr:deoxyribose-phosphate aldolase [Oscillospiraceae bacterium]